MHVLSMVRSVSSTGGPEARDDRSPRGPDQVRERIVTLALDERGLSPRELAVRFTDAERYFVSEASVYRPAQGPRSDHRENITIKAADMFKDKTTALNQLWQTDFTYLKVTGCGLVLAFDHPRRVLPLHHRLETLHHDEDRGRHRHVGTGPASFRKTQSCSDPSDLGNGSSYVSSNLAEWLEQQDMQHTRGAGYHLMTQGNIERWHQTLKNRILLENYYLPGDLEAQMDAFVAQYNHRRYHESIDNLTPADVYFGRGQTILLERERIKRKTIKEKPSVASPQTSRVTSNQDAPDHLLNQVAPCHKISDDGQ